MWSKTGIANLSRLRRATVPVLTSAFILGAMPGGVQLAHAQGKTAGSAKSQGEKEVAKQALETIREANQLYTDGKYPEAFDKYEQAYALYPDPAILVRLGKTAEKLDEGGKALGYYKEFVRLMPDDPASAEVSQAIARLEAQETVKVTVLSEPDGAEVFVDKALDEAVGTTPATLELTPGAHELRLTREGFEDASKTIEVVAGESQDVSVTLNRQMLAEPALSDVSEPVEPTDDAAHLDIYGWSVLGLGVATLATSGVFYGMAISGEDDVNNYNKRAPGASRAELEQMKDDVNSDYDATLVTGIIGGVLAATGAGLLTYHYFVAPDAQETQDIAWGLDAGVDGQSAWLGINGNF